MSADQSTVPPNPTPTSPDNHPPVHSNGANTPTAQTTDQSQPAPVASPTAQDSHPLAHSNGAHTPNAETAPEPVPAVSPTAQDTHEQDPLGMGRTAGQRTAEVFAGLRAELMRSPAYRDASRRA